MFVFSHRLGTDLGRNVAPGASSTPQVINLPPTQTVIDVSGEAKKGKICQQLRKLNEQIENLQTSEEERLARELQAIELNIQEAERKIHHVSCTVRPTSHAPTEEFYCLLQIHAGLLGRQKNMGINTRDDGPPDRT